MKIKRNDFSRLVINDFMSGSLPNGYEKHLNGKFVYKFSNRYCY